jgi:hypothetical protein
LIVPISAALLCSALHVPGSASCCLLLLLSPPQALLSRAETAQAQVDILQAIVEKLESDAEDNQAAQGTAPLSSTYDAALGAIGAVRDQVEALRAETSEYSGYADLRARALNPAEAAAESDSLPEGLELESLMDLSPERE